MTPKDKYAMDNLLGQGLVQEKLSSLVKTCKPHENESLFKHLEHKTYSRL